MGNTRATPTLGSIFNHYTNSGWFTATLQELKDLFAASSSSSYRPAFSTQYESPLTGTTVEVTDGGGDIFLLLTPAGTLADLDIKLPAGATSVQDKQEIKVFSTQAISALTIDVNGATAVLGTPGILAALGSFTVRYDSQNKTWYNVV